MVDKVLKLFGMARDWKEVWRESGDWTVIEGNGTRVKKCHYFIHYSKSLNKYRMSQVGHNHEYHTMLLAARMALIAFEKGELKPKSD